jgi:hypothetical protein
VNISCFALRLENGAEALIEPLGALYAAAQIVSCICRSQPIPIT